ncbi:MAG: T9SS type A sorting domain-containing protein [Bacteroidales bacterium]|nr:T9SS type A sorting domain-containing protein [Bacteroidales bacterium]
MKKLYALTVCVLFCLAGSSQTYAPWEPSQGPLNFMTLDVQNHPYIRLTYNESYNAGIDNYENTTVPGPNPHHQLITTNGQDPCRCFSIVGTNYVHEQYFPTTDIITKPNGSQVDTIIQLGNTSLNNNSQIEYWFYPQENESVLLVCFSFAEEDVAYHEALENSRFYIEVLDGQTNQLIQSGYYPTEAATIAGNPTPTNFNWPFSRFLAVPSGENSGQDHSVWSDNLQSYVYYWAFPQATPTTFPYRECPSNQTSGQSSYPVKWFEYKPVAFDLSSYAAQHKSVKLRIRSRSCQYFAHWSYALFYAKMVSGGGIVTSTDEQPLFHISAPQGFMEPTYEWHYGYDYTDAVNRPEFEIYNTPGVTASGPYDIFIDPAATAPNFHIWPYFCCKVRSYTGVPFVFEYHLRKYHIDADFSYQPDSGDVVHFQDFSSVCYTVPGVEFDTVYEDIHQFRWYVKQNGEFTLFAENESNPSYTFTPATVSDGEATVMLVVSDSLNQVSDTVVRSFPMSLTGIPAHERGSVTVTPNPTRGTVRVTADRDIQNIRILNADGKQLNTITPHDRTTTLDLGHYDGSLFLLEVRFKDGGNVVKKVVKR